MVDLNFQKKYLSWSKFLPLIFLGLGLILLVELVYAVKVLTFPASAPAGRNVAAPIQPEAGIITLSAPQNTYRVNGTVPVKATIVTGTKAVDGVDLLIRYDPKILEATSSGLIKGRIFGEYPLLSVDESNGLISVSGISNLRSGFRGKGQFLLINFKAKAPGKTALKIDFKGDGSTTDSNLVEAGTSKDILKQVVNLELLVQ